jgi:RNA polymerase sigma-70 factor (ECF subfamily)
VRDDNDSDDIVQEALVAVLRGLATYRGEGRFVSWVDRVVARVTFAELPKRRRSPVRSFENVPDLSLLPGNSAVAEEYLNRRRLVQLLDEIPDAQRHVLILHHVLEFSVPEIAGELNIATETVRSRLRLGRKRLRLLLQAAESNTFEAIPDACSTAT